jgi:predicted deacylase
VVEARPETHRSGAALADPEAAVDERGSAPVVAPRSTATVIGRSVQDRVIEEHAFGAGERPVLVIGAIHGDEPTSEGVTRGLIQELETSLRSAEGVPVVIVPVANPDGLAAGTRGNARGIDVNRNFPASNWKELPRGRAFNGKTPASEPETRALIATIERLRPRLVVSVHSAPDGRECNNYDGPAREIAERMTRANGCPSVPTIGYPTPGSLGSWVGNDLGIATITLELPRSLSAPRAWDANRAALLAAIAAVRDAR